MGTPTAWGVLDMDGEDLHSVHIFKEDAEKASFGLGTAIPLVPAAAAPLTPAILADALDTFWNAALGEAHARESSAAFDLASVLAVGFSAVATRLREQETVGHA